MVIARSIGFWLAQRRRTWSGAGRDRAQEQDQWDRRRGERPELEQHERPDVSLAGLPTRTPSASLDPLEESAGPPDIPITKRAQRRGYAKRSPPIVSMQGQDDSSAAGFITMNLRDAAGSSILLRAERRVKFQCCTWILRRMSDASSAAGSLLRFTARRLPSSRGEKPASSAKYSPSRLQSRHFWTLQISRARLRRAHRAVCLAGAEQRNEPATSAVFA